VARDAFGGVLDGRTPLVTRHSYSGNLDDSEEVLAHTLSGLRLWTDDTGLRFRARLRDTRLAAIVVNKIRHGELAGVSATYRVDASEYGDTAKLITRCRELEEISLLFDSDRPAFQGTWARILHVPVGMSIYSPDFRDHASATAADSARRQLGLRVLTPTGG
jgi:HK97 family phage prohead protease